VSFAEGYVDVATRIQQFRDLYPTGSLQPADHTQPVVVMTIGDKTFLQYVACAYRSPDDERPGIGVAWEPFPGQTSFTKNSEAMVAETSAWGRAIVAVLAADAKRGVASAEEVRNREIDRAAPAPDPLAAIKAEVWVAAQAVNIKDAQTLAAHFAESTGGLVLKDADETQLATYLEVLKAAA